MVPRRFRVLLVAALVLILLEGGLRLAAGRLAEPLDWYHETAQQAIHHMDQWEEAGLTADVAFVGTSMVRAGVQVATIEDELASVERGANVGLPAGQVPVVRRWLLEEVLPRIQPKRVVWAVQSLDFNSGRIVPTIDRYEEARAVRDGVLGVLDRCLSSLSALSRYRAQLRDPAFLLDLWRPVPSPSSTPLEDLLSPTNASARNRQTPRELRRIRETVLNDFHVGRTEREDFATTVRTLQHNGVEVVVVLMPVPSGYVEAHTRGEADFAAFRQWITAESDRLGIPLLDYSRSLPDEAFHDYTHLSADPAVQFSRALSADLRRLGW